MLNGRMIGAAGLALVMMMGAGSTLVMGQPAKKAAGKAARTPVPTAAEVKAAEEAYTTKCAVCHTPDGNSPIENMNFSDSKWLHGSTTADVIKTITDGVPGTAMMPFGTQFTPGEIAALARKVRSFDKTLK